MTQQVQIPLNTFKLLTDTLVTGDNIIYQENVKNVSAIILSIQVANTTEILQRVSVKIRKGVTDTFIIKNAIVPPEEVLNPLSGKIVLEKGDGLVFEAFDDNVLDATISILENAND
jgi:hypothetical protein